MRFLEKANLPDEKVKYMLISPECPKEILDHLQAIGVKIIFSYKNELITDSVSTHPDASILHMGRNIFITDMSALEYYQSKLTNAHVYTITAKIKSPYPEDALLNACVINENMFANNNTIDQQILLKATELQKTIIKVRQGYTKCNIAVISENAIITEDANISAAAKASGVDVLFLNPGNVKLDGYSYGFIGGSCGKLSNDLIAFTGCVNSDIKSFCRTHGVYVYELTNKEPLDIGSIIPIAYDA